MSEALLLPVSIEVSSEWLPYVAAPGVMNAALCKGVEHGVAVLMEQLGVPGRASVTVSNHAAPAGSILRVLADSRLTRYPDDVLLFAYAYATEHRIEPEITPGTIAAAVKASFDNGSANLAVEFLIGACLEIVKLQPAVLLGPPQVDAYAAAPGLAEHRAELPSLLGHLLDMGISVANVAAVCEVLSGEPRPSHVILETLIERLRAETVEIQLPRGLLQSVTTRWQGGALELFPLMRDGLFVESGLELPPLRFVAVDDLKSNFVTLKLNDVTSSPLRLLDADQCLINDTVDRARLQGLTAQSATNPATGQPNSVVGLAQQAVAESLGLTTWNQLQYLVLWLAECLRRHGWRTVHHRGITEQLKTTERYFPGLVSTFRARHSDEELTSVLRALVRDRVSVQNLRVILEQWLDYDMLRDATSSTRAGRDATLADPCTFARVGLGREIANNAARRTGTLVVYLLDREIERLVSPGPASQLGERGSDILRALRSELAYLPPTAAVPSILTFVEARSPLQRLIATEFPRMSVIAHEELPPGINVQPVARISLTS